MLISSACARAANTVAISTKSSANVADKQLVDALLPLLEHAVGEKKGLQVVEREQAAALVAELARSLESNNANPLAVGQIDPANLLVTVELSPAEEDSKNRFTLVRITEGATAVVRGETAVPISAALIEEATAEIADFVATIAQGPTSRSATLAVLPFESVERFDRLRPLERGLRDLFVANLLQLETCRVVQRSSMEQLLAELELVRAGLTNEGRGLEAAPEREAAYVLRGEIDERNTPNGNLVVIVAELVEVKSLKVVLRSEHACLPQAIAEQVAEIATEISKFVSASDDRPVPAKNAGIKEIDRLYELALRDVYRFNRYNPEDAGYRPFRIPNVQQPAHVQQSVEPESPLGVHLLQKSIDRLESILFLEPERLTAALPLAYCLSFHIDGVWNPERCEQLLRRIRAETTDSEMYEIANELLADMYFTHEGCLFSEQDIAEVDPELLRLGFDRRLEAFATSTKDGLSIPRIRMLYVLENICSHTQNQQQWSRLLNTLAKVVEAPVTQQSPPKVQDRLLSRSSAFAASIVRNKKGSAQTQREAEALLERWRDSDDRWRRLYGKRRLLELHPSPQTQQELDALLEESFVNDTDPHVQQSLIMEKTQLAKRLLHQQKAVEALRILEGIQPLNIIQMVEHDITNSYYGYHLGQCYEALGRKREALDVYLHYVGMPPGHFLGLDVTKRIDALGGVPLDKNRDIDIEYLDVSAGEPFHCKVLATDGNRLYCSGGFELGRRGPQAVPLKSVRQLDFATGDWTNLGGPDDRVSCLAVADGFLWAGTDHDGLWRRSLKTGEWRQWTTDDGLPTNSIVAIAAHGPIAYTSVANIDSLRKIVSGGIVRIDPNADAPIHIYRDQESPQTAPASMSIHAGQLVVPGVEGRLHSLDLITQQWHELSQSTIIVDAGRSGIWYTPFQHIALLPQRNEGSSKSYPLTSSLKNYPGAYSFPSFFVEHDGQLWIGGRTWRRFNHSGLSRLDLTTGELTLYGPPDGFRYDDQNHYECYDAVWAKDRLWVATSFGLAEVALRDPANQNEATPIEKYAQTIKPLLPKGWSLTVTGNMISVRREQPVLITPLYGRPGTNEGETVEEYLRRIGSFIPLEIDLRFIHRLSPKELETRKAHNHFLERQGARGFPDKAQFSRHLQMQELNKLPVYFDENYSIFVDGVPPQYTMHDDAARGEMKTIFAKLKDVLEPYK
ncbi:CsgG/HfaB family protein [Bythopirellula goksoeyrii]|nr:CsgG/HfaB family protein [Bythopirellula goksoeyrii]